MTRTSRRFSANSFRLALVSLCTLSIPLQLANAEDAPASILKTPDMVWQDTYNRAKMPATANTMLAAPATEENPTGENKDTENKDAETPTAANAVETPVDSGGILHVTVIGAAKKQFTIQVKKNLIKDGDYMATADYIIHRALSEAEFGDRSDDKINLSFVYRTPPASAVSEGSRAQESVFRIQRMRWSPKNSDEKASEVLLQPTFKKKVAINPFLKNVRKIKPERQFAMADVQAIHIFLSAMSEPAWKSFTRNISQDALKAAISGSVLGATVGATQ